jgi:hypothetical protein
MSTNETVTEDERRTTDLRVLNPHYSYREVAAVQHCADPDVIEPIDPVSSDSIDAALRQARKQLRGTSS